MSLSALLPTAAVTGVALATGMASRAAQSISSGVSSFAGILSGLGDSPTIIPEPMEKAKELPPELQAGLHQFADLLRQKLAELGVSPDTPLTLSTDVLGDVTADGDSAAADAVQQLFQSDPQLTAQFQSLAAAWRQANVPTTSVHSALSWDHASATQGVQMTLAGNTLQITAS